MGLCYALITFLSICFYEGGFICSRIRLHQFHVWFCRGKESNLHIRIHLRMRGCFGSVTECEVVFVAESEIGLGHDDVIRVLGRG